MPLDICCLFRLRSERELLRLREYLLFILTPRRERDLDLEREKDRDESYDRDEYERDDEREYDRELERDRLR